MAQGVNIDDVLITWGDRLFYPKSRLVPAGSTARLGQAGLQRRAAVMRGRIAATVARRAPQVMVKVTGGGRGVNAIAAHFRYISKNGRLGLEDERGEALSGPCAVRDLAEEWRFGGSLIPEEAAVPSRREAFNIMLSMPRGTDPLAVRSAARTFARAEFADHKHVMVLHDHQANPHVHLSVRAESKTGKRLRPRKADLHRWRERFAENLQALGVDAEATRQATRILDQRGEPIWRLKAGQEGRLRKPRQSSQSEEGGRRPTLAQAAEAWQHIAQALATSADLGDLRLARAIASFLEQPQAERVKGRIAPSLEPGRRSSHGPQRER